MGMLELKKQYKPADPSMKVDYSGTDFVCMIVLKKDGSLDVYKKPGDPEFKEADRQTPSHKAPGNPKVSQAPGSGHQVKVSSFMSMVGSPGCVCINGTEWYW